MPQAEGRSRPWRDHRQVVERSFSVIAPGCHGVIFPLKARSMTVPHERHENGDALDDVRASLAEE
jgi:hypothetical protein